MHLVVTIIATVAAFFVWYVVGRNHKKFHLEILPIMLGAASVMWMVDGFFGLFGEDKKFLGIEPYVVENGKIVGEASAEQIQEFFYQGMNDLALGVAIIAAALLVYAIILFIIDPLNVWRKNKEVKEEKQGLASLFFLSI